MTNTKKFRAALVQMTSCEDVDTNLDVVEHFIKEAVNRGADYVQTPENTTLMVMQTEKLFENIQPEENNKALNFYRQLAQKHDICLHIGGMAVIVDPQKAANRSYVIGPDGEIIAKYDKIHMFDAKLPNGEYYKESKNFDAGEKAVIAKTSFANIGLTICYDLRFPYLYRKLAHLGAEILAVPSAFTVPTGIAHWHTLLRARAIETGSYVFAAAQCGCHENGRKTYGHSIIVSPWGETIIEAGVAPCCIYADIDMAEITKARQIIPSLQHDQAIS